MHAARLARHAAALRVPLACVRRSAAVVVAAAPFRVSPAATQRCRACAALPAARALTAQRAAAPPSRRGFCGDAAALAPARTLAPLRQRNMLRPRGVAVAAVASLGFIAAAASFAAATLFGSVFLAALAVLDAHLASAAPEVVTGAGARTRSRLAAAPALLETYRPFPGLRNRHASTIWPVYFRSIPQVVQYWRECVRCADGGHVTLDWLLEGGARDTPSDAAPAAASHSASAGGDPSWPPLSRDSPVIILLSGIAGGSADSYVKHFVAMARAAGLRPVCFNSRGCANGPVTVPQFYSASFTGDIREVVLHVRAKYPTTPLFALGWSLGANILVNYLGEEGAAAGGAATSAALGLDGAASLCNPFDLVTCDIALEHGMGRVYSKSMGDGLRRNFSPHEALFRGLPRYDAAAAARSVTVRHFDEAITRRSFGFPSVDHYYRASGSAQRLPAVAVPLLCVQAADDPIAVDEAVPREAAAANPNVALVVTPSGGHLGWITQGGAGATGAPWPYKGVLQWFAALAEEVAADRPKKTGGAARPLAAAGRD